MGFFFSPFFFYGERLKVYDGDIFIMSSVS